MPFVQSAQTKRAKYHLSNVRLPVVAGIAAVALVAIFLTLHGVWNLVNADSFELLKKDDHPSSQEVASGGGVQAGSAEDAGKRIAVHVGGAVVRPGVYELKEGTRVLGAVEAAGGFIEGAATDSLNLARTLNDGEQVLILSLGEIAASPAASSGGSSAQAARKVNINTAGTGDLATLPGIGESTAKKIVADRESNGPFRTVEELTRVSGIGEKKLADLAPLVTV